MRWHNFLDKQVFSFFQPPYTRGKSIWDKLGLNLDPLALLATAPTIRLWLLGYPTLLNYYLQNIIARDEVIPLQWGAISGRWRHQSRIKTILMVWLNNL